MPRKRCEASHGFRFKTLLRGPLRHNASPWNTHARNPGDDCTQHAGLRPAPAFGLHRLAGHPLCHRQPLPAALRCSDETLHAQALCERATHRSRTATLCVDSAFLYDGRRRNYRCTTAHRIHQTTPRATSTRFFCRRRARRSHLAPAYSTHHRHAGRFTGERCPETPTWIAKPFTSFGTENRHRASLEREYSSARRGALYRRTGSFCSATHTTRGLLETRQGVIHAKETSPRSGLERLGTGRERFKDPVDSLELPDDILLVKLELLD